MSDFVFALVAFAIIIGIILSAVFPPSEAPQKPVAAPYRPRRTTPVTTALKNVQNCPVRRLDPSHYREDGSCRCGNG